MPFVWIKASEEISVELPEPGFMSEWESAEAERDCEEYNHPKSGVWCRIENPDDSISPGAIPINDKDAIEGSIEVVKIGDTHWVFRIRGIFKVSVHKDTAALMKRGLRPRLESVVRFREQYGLSHPRNVDWEFSLKKI